MSKRKNYRAENSDEDDHEQPQLKRKKCNLDASNECQPQEEENTSPYLECCVCMLSDLDDLSILVDNEKPIQKNGFHPFATLSDCDDGISLNNQTIFMSCCNKHAICYNCLKTLVMNFDNHPIGIKYPLIRCPHPFSGDEGCVSSCGMPNYFSHSDIRKILNRHEFQMYMNHAERFQFPGYEIVKCPRPLISDDTNDISVCGAWILIPINVIQNASPGNIIMECNQNPQCHRRSCYHCLTLIRNRGVIPIFDNDDVGGVITDNGLFCDYCATNAENTNPRAVNRYFYRQNKQLKDAQPLFFRNEELNNKIIIPQLQEIVCSETLLTRCFECLTTIYKTEQCNTITHCKIERCYACGRSGTCEQDLGDHWDASGLKGCPRFDYSNFWNEWSNCDFLCKEGVCYGDELGSCNRLSHQPGIKAMIDVRKKAHIYHAIKSLIPSVRDNLIKEVYNIEELRHYLPKYICNEHRAYLADVIFDKMTQAQIALLEIQGSINNIEQELLKFQDRQHSYNIELDNSSDLVIDISTSSDSDNELDDLDNIRVRQFKNIMNKLSSFEFDKIDYPISRLDYPISSGVVDVDDNSLAFERLKKKYLVGN